MRKFMRTRAAILLAIAVLFLGVGSREAAAANLIRDAEIENTIRAYATPLFEAAGLPPQDIRIYIINDPTLNAFVAGGMNLFINTGLLMKTKNAGELIGVIAHETGHIADGHLARFANQSNTASNEAIIATVLGAITALATGRGDAGAAVAQVGQGYALGSLMSFSRSVESAADTAGLKFLDRSHQSAKGFASFMETLESQEFLTARNQSPYVRTHPVTQDRVRHIEDHLKESPYTNAPPNPKFEKMHRRMVAKLTAFLDQPQTTFRKYPPSDESVPARYARAIAYYRMSNLEKALPLINGLIDKEPQNPYFRELKGQMLFENGRVAESLAPYQKSVDLAPDEPLLRVGLAHAQIESGNAALNKKAIKNLLIATNAEPYNNFAWSELAVAYGRDGQIGMSALSQAEASTIAGNLDDASFHIGRAERKLPKSSTAWVRLQDLKREVKERKARREHSDNGR